MKYFNFNIDLYDRMKNHSYLSVECTYAFKWSTDENRINFLVNHHFAYRDDPEQLNCEVEFVAEGSSFHHILAKLKNKYPEHTWDCMTVSSYYDMIIKNLFL